MAMTGNGPAATGWISHGRTRYGFPAIGAIGSGAGRGFLAIGDERVKVNAILVGRPASRRRALPLSSNPYAERCERAIVGVVMVKYPRFRAPPPWPTGVGDARRR